MKSTALFRKPPSKRSTKRQTVKLTVWMKVPLYAEIERIARQERLSLSSVGAAGLEAWLRWDMRKQQDDELFPKLRQLLREDRRASENRIIFFVMRTSFAAEQSRILITNVLKWLLKLFWWIVKPPQTDNEQDFHAVFKTIVADSNLMAQQNIFTRTAQMKRLHEKWQAGEQTESEEGDSGHG